MAETLIYDPANQGMNNLGGWGGGVLGFILGALVGNGGFGNGFGFGGGAGAAAALGAQEGRNNNTDLILNAINGTDADVRLLASTLNADIDSVRVAINTVQGAISGLSSQMGLTGQQIINSIQSGNAALASQLCQCCCEMKQTVTTQGFENQIATLNQTNTLNNAIVGGNQRIVDAISDLKTTTISEFCAARERDMQSKIDSQADVITQLRGQISNDRQTAQFSAMLAPIIAQVNAIAARQPATVPVIWPNLTVTETTTTSPTEAKSFLLPPITLTHFNFLAPELSPPSRTVSI